MHREFSIKRILRFAVCVKTPSEEADLSNVIFCQGVAGQRLPRGHYLIATSLRQVGECRYNWPHRILCKSVCVTLGRVLDVHDPC